VQPQGKGFVGFGVGIMGMRERAEQLGGRLELASNDVGTRLSVTLPLVHPNEENASSVGGRSSGREAGHRRRRGGRRA
jgi:glucose-6-phosphate-specific signal transduction histidine kinase